MPKLPHMTLGQLDAFLKTVSPTMFVRYELFGLFWQGFHSWRGRYAEPAIGWAPWGASTYDFCTVASMRKEVQEALNGQEYHGWKGGEYSYDASSPIWVDNPGDCTGTYLTKAYIGKYESVTLSVARDWDVL